MHRFAFTRAAAWLEPRTVALLVYLVARLTSPKAMMAPSPKAMMMAPSPKATDPRGAPQAPSTRARGHAGFAGEEEEARELLRDVAFDELGDFFCDHPEAWALALAVSAAPSAAPDALVRGTRTLRRLHVAQRRYRQPLLRAAFGGTEGGAGP